TIMPVNWSSVWRHSLPSRFADHGALNLAVGIVGARQRPVPQGSLEYRIQVKCNAVAERFNLPPAKIVVIAHMYQLHGRIGHPDPVRTGKAR
ncbi:MAG TPA: hypothetical protein VNZ06_13145, partial [Steroidobacteraceae bacterium]|nr:hypothetical protein [Steroidobacteraceae bacterium]